jgi:CO/xanthine dehydrogenase Mo-binding subunit
MKRLAPALSWIWWRQLAPSATTSAPQPDPCSSDQGKDRQHIDNDHENQISGPAARFFEVLSRGEVTVDTDMTNIGTGSYTIIAQTAAEMMGVTIDKVTVRLGDSSFPTSAGSGGQWGANSSTAGVYAACVKLRDAVAQKMGVNSADAVFAYGQVRSGNRSMTLAQAAGQEGIMAEDTIEYGDLGKRYQQSTFGAHFVEVAVTSRPAKRTSAACLRFARPGASSIPRRRAARGSAP